MKRPYLVNFLAIESDEFISIKTSVSETSSTPKKKLFSDEIKNPANPLQSISLLSGEDYLLKVIGIDDDQNEVYSKIFESDSFGNFEIRFPKLRGGKEIKKLNIYEMSTRPGMALLVGSFIPISLGENKKIVISDFDKTLVDTKYSTPKELYYSLSKPVTYFPKVQSSIDIIKDYINRDYTPFILSASPHFYENAIRDWLYLHQLYTSNIFLKDYRSVFSLFEGDLTPKDLKTQGFYKLNHLVSIILMTGIPDEMILMGDSFESDTLIYLTLCSIVIAKEDPWKVWNQIKKMESFKLTTKQNSQFLSKMYQLSSMVKSHPTTPEIKVLIRCKEDTIEQIKQRTYSPGFLNIHAHLVEYYVG